MVKLTMWILSTHSPPCLIPISQSYRKTEHQIAFFRKYCPLSNHCPAPIKINDKEYNCTEQMFLSEKCYAYGHQRSGDLIRTMTDPAMMVQEAKVCQGYNDNWDKDMYDIMLTAQLAKYTQNQIHRDFLIATGDRRLVEGSPYDSVWGVGVAFTDPKIDDMKNWKGDNLLGEALMATRRLLLPRSPIARKPHSARRSSELLESSEPAAVTDDESMELPPTQTFTPTMEDQEESS